MARSRTWCFTDFLLEHTDDEWRQYGEVRGVAWLYVGATECCPSTGRHHRHGIIHFEHPKRQLGVQRAIHITDCHVEVQLGTPEQAVEYASKNGIVHESGRPRGRRRGNRTDLAGVVECIRDGSTPSEIDISHPLVGAKYGSWVRRVFADTLRRKQLVFRTMAVVVLWGEPGTGKSRKAFADAGDDSFVFPLQRPGTCWFDTYEGQDTLVIDEFEGELPLNHLLKILDGHRFTGELKGSHTHPIWTKVWLTSNTHPKDWYPEAHEVKTRALLRRITSIIHFDAAFS